MTQECYLKEGREGGRREGREMRPKGRGWEGDARTYQPIIRQAEVLQVSTLSDGFRDRPYSGEGVGDGEEGGRGGSLPVKIFLESPRSFNATHRPIASGSGPSRASGHQKQKV